MDVRVEPVDPVEGLELDVFDVAPGAVGGPVRSPTPSRRRFHIAISRVSSTSSVVMAVAARQPTIRRERASKTNATYTVPDQVAT